MCMVPMGIAGLLQGRWIYSRICIGMEYNLKGISRQSEGCLRLVCGSTDSVFMRNLRFMSLREYFHIEDAYDSKKT